jgi:hypothetical protein
VLRLELTGAPRTYCSSRLNLVSTSPQQYFRPLSRLVQEGEEIELELELIETQMAQKPMLRAEVYARELRAIQTRRDFRCGWETVCLAVRARHKWETVRCLTDVPCYEGAHKKS